MGSRVSYSTVRPTRSTSGRHGLTEAAPKATIANDHTPEGVKDGRTPRAFQSDRLVDVNAGRWDR